MSEVVTRPDARVRAQAQAKRGVRFLAGAAARGPRLLPMRGARSTWRAVAVIVAVVLLANLPFLTGWVQANPLAQRSELAAAQSLGPLNGASVLDPNDGYVSQALGHRAALDLLHGHLPWWDPFEGAGAPLAGEMQSAALFPGTLLLALSNGQLYEHILLEVLAGIGTYVLLRRLRVGWTAAVAGGCAFALNGTFVWYAHAPVNPIAFLPWLLVGIELCYSAAVEGRRGGWWLVAVALALSLYAGFPETAYIDGLLGLIWFGWRAACAGRAHVWRLVGKVAAGGIGGILLAAPLLVAFADTLARSSTGLHGGFAGGLWLPARALPQLVMPYVYGPILAFGDPGGQMDAIWGRTGGYVTILLVLLALVSLADRRHRGLKAALVVWLVLAIARMYHEPPLLEHVIGVLPGMSSVYFFRYAFPAVELAVIVLAALGLDALASPRRRPVIVAALVTFLALALAAIAAHGLVVQFRGPGGHSKWARAAVAWALLSVLGAAGLALARRGGRTRLTLLAMLVVLDTAGMFFIHDLSAPSTVRLDTAPVSFLQAHLGLNRFFTLGPIQPQYGAYFGLASVNVDDVPVPSAWTAYIKRRLDPTVNPLVFVGNNGGGRSTSAPSPAQELVSHLDAYRAAAVSYVLAAPGQSLPETPGALHLVRRTTTAWIYSLGGAAPYFSAPGCSLSSQRRESLRVRCGAAALLTRRELEFPGWRASVDGAGVAVRRSEGLFQAVAVPAGEHTVSFSYSPPHIVWGLVAFGVGLAWLAVAVALRGGRRS